MHWASERPDEVIERNLHVTKATAWVALSAQGVIGPFWFCNEDGAMETVTADRYMNVLTRFWRALGRFCGHEARVHAGRSRSSYGTRGLDMAY